MGCDQANQPRYITIIFNTRTASMKTDGVGVVEVLLVIHGFQWMNQH